jgi:hypothetical protein
MPGSHCECNWWQTWVPHTKRMVLDNFSQHSSLIMNPVQGLLKSDLWQIHCFPDLFDHLSLSRWPYVCHHRPWKCRSKMFVNCRFLSEGLLSANAQHYELVRVKSIICCKKIGSSYKLITPHVPLVSWLIPPDIPSKCRWTLNTGLHTILGNLWLRASMQ